MVGFWEKEFDVLVCTTIVESRHRHPERQHAHRRAGRPARPGPAAPDPRPGRPRPRAGVRLLPLPAGEAAHRARARAAGHHRPAHRARRRHVRGDEGPGDPRRRQPARRRAVRPHRGRRLRPLRADGRRGGGSSSRASAPEEEADVKVDLPVDAHLPHDYIGVERLRLEMYRKLAEARDRRAARRGGRRDARPVRRAAGAGRNLFAVARFRLLARAYGLTDVSLQGKHIRFAPLPLPDSKQLRLKRLPPGRGLQAGDRPVSACPGRRPAGSAASRCATRRCWSGAPSCSRTCSARPGRRADRRGRPAVLERERERVSTMHRARRSGLAARRRCPRRRAGLAACRSAAERRGLRRRHQVSRRSRCEAVSTTPAARESIARSRPRPARCAASW